jgi:hypothetical protein
MVYGIGQRYPGLRDGVSAPGAEDMIKELDSMVLAVDLPAHRLKAGDVGTIVRVHAGGKGFEVEFVALDGETIAVVTLTPAELRPVGRREIVHARPLPA